MLLARRLAALPRMMRALKIWRTVLTLLALLWWDGQRWTYRGEALPEQRAARQKRRARWLTAELIHLGSAFIKLGQLLSARPDILPAGWVEDQTTTPKGVGSRRRGCDELGNRWWGQVDWRHNTLGERVEAVVGGKGSRFHFRFR